MAPLVVGDRPALVEDAEPPGPQADVDPAPDEMGRHRVRICVRQRWSDIKAITAAAERAVPEVASRLVDRVRARTLDLLGDHAGAMAIVERALRRSA